ncbi:MAG TPA: tetratricopeptide repeat protein [Allosphingosinicella sp.]
MRPRRLVAFGLACMSYASASQTIPEAGRPASPAERRQLLNTNQRLARENQRIERASERHRINYATLRSALAQRLSVNRDISDSELIALVESTAREAAEARSAIAGLRAQAAAVAVPPPTRETEQAIGLAERGFTAGRFDEARRSLAEIRLQRQQAARVEQSRPAVVAWLNAIDAEARTAILQGDHADAADLYLAAMAEPGLNHAVRLRLAYLAADMFGRSARFTGRTEPVRRQVAILHGTALPLVPREKYPVEWADTMNDLGFALHNLGHMLDSRSTLEDSLTAYREAIKVYEEVRQPGKVADTLINVANSQFRIAELDGRPNGIEEAVRTYRLAQRTITRARAPLAWAVIQGNIGVALTALAKREGGLSQYPEAIAVLRESLAITTFDLAPRQWATGQINLALALGGFGRRTNDASLMEEAVAAYEAGLKVWTRNEHPFRWASIRLDQAEIAARIARLAKDRTALGKTLTSVREARGVAVELAASELVEQADRILAELESPN